MDIQERIKDLDVNMILWSIIDVYNILPVNSWSYDTDDNRVSYIYCVIFNTEDGHGEFTFDNEREFELVKLLMDHTKSEEEYFQFVDKITDLLPEETLAHICSTYWYREQIPESKVVTRIIRRLIKCGKPLPRKTVKKVIKSIDFIFLRVLCEEGVQCEYIISECRRLNYDEKEIKVLEGLASKFDIPDTKGALLEDLN